MSEWANANKVMFDHVRGCEISWAVVAVRSLPHKQVCVVYWIVLLKIG